MIFSDVGLYSLVASTDKTNGLHTRIIWTCSWTHDSLAFVTGSREGKVVVWGSALLEKDDLAYKPLSQALMLKDSVTALAFAPTFLLGDSTRYLLGIGGEKGWIHCYSWNRLEDPWKLCYQVQRQYPFQITISSRYCQTLRSDKISLEFKELLQSTNKGEECWLLNFSQYLRERDTCVQYTNFKIQINIY